jgi:hypothetical protein
MDVSEGQRGMSVCVVPGKVQQEEREREWRNHLGVRQCHTVVRACKATYKL